MLRPCDAQNVPAALIVWAINSASLEKPPRAPSPIMYVSLPTETGLVMVTQPVRNIVPTMNQAVFIFHPLGPRLKIKGGTSLVVRRYSASQWNGRGHIGPNEPDVSSPAAIDRVTLHTHNLRFPAKGLGISRCAKGAGIIAAKG